MESTRSNEPIGKIWKVHSSRGPSEQSKSDSSLERKNAAASKPKVSKLRRCTWCNNMRLKPTPAKGMEKLLFLILFRPYMCDHCKNRFYRPIGG